ncbi:hypothetical protein ACKZDW_07570 [Ralstonia syzygii subsp. celebesensis]|nr:hypothetical protein [Ralstonia syzygii]
MKQLHDARFKDLQRRFEADPFYESMPPPDDDEHVDQIIDYNRKAQAFAQQMQAEQEALLLQCAGLRTAQAS